MVKLKSKNLLNPKPKPPIQIFTKRNLPESVKRALCHPSPLIQSKSVITNCSGPAIFVRYNRVRYNRVNLSSKMTNMSLKSVRYNRVFVNNRVRYNRVSLYIETVQFSNLAKLNFVNICNGGLGLRKKVFRNFLLVMENLCLINITCLR